MFHYLKKNPYIICTFFVKFIHNEYIRPYFLSHVVSMIFTSDLPEVEPFLLEGGLIIYRVGVYCMSECHEGGGTGACLLSTLNMIFSITYYLDLHNAIYFTLMPFCMTFVFNYTQVYPWYIRQERIKITSWVAEQL